MQGSLQFGSVGGAGVGGGVPSNLSRGWLLSFVLVLVVGDGKFGKLTGSELGDPEVSGLAGPKLGDGRPGLPCGDGKP